MKCIKSQYGHSCRQSCVLLPSSEPLLVSWALEGSGQYIAFLEPLSQFWGHSPKCSSYHVMISAFVLSFITAFSIHWWDFSISVTSAISRCYTSCRVLSFHDVYSSSSFSSQSFCCLRYSGARGPSSWCTLDACCFKMDNDLNTH